MKSLAKVNTAPRTLQKELAAQKVSFRGFSKNKFIDKFIFLDEDEMNVWSAVWIAAFNLEGCSCK